MKRKVLRAVADMFSLELAFSVKGYHRSGVPPSTIKIGHRVEAVSKARKMPRPRLAALLDLDRSPVTKWATEGTAPRDLNATAEALGVEVAAFFAASVTRALSRKAA